MAERDAPRFESWIDRQIREAVERGEFDNLSGTGKPLPDHGEMYDENWWVKAKMRREGLTYLAPSLLLRRDAEDAETAAADAKSEDEIRRIVAVMNERIADANRNGLDGPAHGVKLLNADRIILDWRRRTGR